MRSTANVDNNTEQAGILLALFCYEYEMGADAHEANNSCHLDGRKDEFGFTVAFDAKEVDDGNHEQEYSDKDGLAETVIPVFDSQRAGDDF